MPDIQINCTTLLQIANLEANRVGGLVRVNGLELDAETVALILKDATRTMQLRCRHAPNGLVPRACEQAHRQRRIAVQLVLSTQLLRPHEFQAVARIGAVADSMRLWYIATCEDRAARLGIVN